MVEEAATPTAIYDCLRLQESKFAGSLSAIKRLCQRISAVKGVSADDVAIPVGTDPGEVAQVDFGSVGQLRDPDGSHARRVRLRDSARLLAPLRGAHRLRSEDRDRLRLHVEALPSSAACHACWSTIMSRGT